MKESRSNLEVCCDIAAALLKFQWKRRTIRQQFAVSSVGISQAHLLLHLDSDNAATASELAKILNLDESSLSRLSHSLALEGLVRKVASSDDRRANDLTITTKGRGVLDELDRSQAVIMNECLKNMTEGETHDLANCLRYLANGLGAAEVPVRKADHPVTLELRRLARGSGMLGGQFMGSMLSLVKLYVVVALFENADTLPFRELSRIIPFDTSTVSRTVTALEKEGYVTKTRAPEDQRTQIVTLTKSGRASYLEYRRTAGERLQKALSKTPGAEAQRFLDLMNKIEGTDTEGNHTAILQDRIVVKRLRNEHDRKRARTFLLERIVDEERHESAPKQLLNVDSEGYALEVNDALQAVCGLHKEGGRWIFDNFAMNPQIGKGTEAELFLRHSLTDFFARTSADKVHVAPELPIELPSTITARAVPKLSLV